MLPLKLTQAFGNGELKHFGMPDCNCQNVLQ